MDEWGFSITVMIESIENINIFDILVDLWGNPDKDSQNKTKMIILCITIIIGDW